MTSISYGIVLKRIDYKENDVILKILTNESQLLSLYARGIKKAQSKNSYACSLLAESEFTYQAKDQKLPFLITGNLVLAHQNLFQDYDLMILATVMADLLAEILAYDDNWPDAFQLFQAYLNMLAKNTDLVALFGLFLVTLLKQLGSSLHVDSCVVCNHSKVVGIDLNLGGFVCRNHASKALIYDKEFLRKFRLINKASHENWEEIIKQEPFEKEIVTILSGALEKYSGLSFKTFKFIQSVFSI